MIDELILALVAIVVGVIVSILTYFINKWLDSHFRK